jgi:hypothetical protein
MTGQDYSLNCREGVFSETELPIRVILVNSEPYQQLHYQPEQVVERQ